MTTADIVWVTDESTTTFGERPSKRTVKTTFANVSGLLPLPGAQAVIESVTITESSSTRHEPSLTVDVHAKRPGQNWTHNVGWANAAIARTSPAEQYGDRRVRLDAMPNDLNAMVEEIIAIGGPLNDAFPTED